ncbi:MAG: class I SAM-dependent methyltransferase [Anaerolineales bacterium]
MKKTPSEVVWQVLRCSNCGSHLEQAENGAICAICEAYYEYSSSGSLNLHLQQTKRYQLDFDIVPSASPANEFDFVPLEENPHPEVNFNGQQIPRHLTREMLSYFPKAKTSNSLMLDLGCGSGIHKAVSEHAGFNWVGFDYSASEAYILGDAHALPFQDNSFEFILCVTVLQYMRYPFVMMREVFRVLKPQGKLIGTVAFLEPYNGVGYYNNTHLGAYNLLQYGGFNVEKLSPGKSWSALKALASMGLFPKMPRRVAQSLVYPLELMHRLWWKMGALTTRKNNENMRLRNFAGSFTFIASKDTV